MRKLLNKLTNTFKKEQKQKIKCKQKHFIFCIPENAKIRINMYKFKNLGKNNKSNLWKNKEMNII